MSDYSQITFFTPKDSLATGNPNKIIYGSDVDAELSAISTAIATKADVDGDAIGAGTPATELSVDNLKLDANKIISTNTDGDIELEPNGAGYVVITNADINGGTIDGAIIGGATPAAITGTTLTANTSLALATGATVTAILDEDAMTSNSATALATQQSIKAYVDSQVTAQDLDVTTDSGTIAIDLDSETLTVAGGTGLDTSATGNTVTVAIDGTVATLTGAQTLTNKVLTSPDINTPDIDGGTIDGTVIGASSPAAATFTTGDFNTSLNVDGTITADGLTVSTTTGSSSITPTDITIKTETSASDWSTTDEWGRLVFYSDDVSNGGAKAHATIGVSPTASGGGLSKLVFKTSNSTPSLVKRMDIDEVGDISFYEDTGTTAKFFWDASAERLGIGDSSPDGILDVEGSITIAGSQAGVIFNPSVTPANNNVGSIGLVSGTLNAPASVNASSKISGLRVAPTTSGSFNGAGEVAGVKVETFNGQSATLATGLYVDAPTGGDVNYAAILNGGNVGIGTSSPDTLMELRAANPVLTIRDTETSTASNDARLRLAETGVSDALGNYYDIGYIQGVLQFRYNTSEYMRLDASGNLLVGTDAINAGLDSVAQFEVSEGTAGGIVINTATAGASNYCRLMFSVGNATGNEGLIRYNTSDYHMSFWTEANERMRIDASGNLLVGTTTANPTGLSNNTPGVELSATGGLRSSVDDDVSGTFNRKTNEGPLLLLRVDGDTKGIVGIAGSRPYLSNRINFSVKIDDFANGSFIPADEDGAASDNVSDIGSASARWDDIYATNGTIQTSDANEKQDIRDLSEAEARVAQAAKALLKAFRWKDSVAEKGDDARIHFGIIAQDLQAAFEAEGLDAGRYAMFIHSTWTDEETGEERSRMGVRYSELLAFIIAAL